MPGTATGQVSLIIHSDVPLEGAISLRYETNDTDVVAQSKCTQVLKKTSRLLQLGLITQGFVGRSLAISCHLSASAAVACWRKKG